MKSATRDLLIKETCQMLRCIENQKIRGAEQCMRLDPGIYTEPLHHRREIELLFRRVPLILAASAELPLTGDYRTVELAGIPLLITRGADHKVQVYLNACTHRGAQVVTGSGNSGRFTCPYHGWTYAADGRLIGISSAEVFDHPDKSAGGLITFPAEERGGFIWALLTQDAELPLTDFLGTLEDVIEAYQLQNWHLFHQNALDGPNWKLAFDAHLEFYHLPVLHRNTFGTQISNMAQYFFYGPHQRLGLMSDNTVGDNADAISRLSTKPIEQWSTEDLLFGEWIIFPNVSLNCFDLGVRAMVLSQILPTADSQRSVTVQTFLTESIPDDEHVSKVNEFVEFIQSIVRDEDLALEQTQQQTINSGLMPEFLLGKNEEGLQHHHATLQRILAHESPLTSDFWSQELARTKTST